MGAWFVPFLNLVRPKQIIDDIWYGTDPELPNASIAMGRQWSSVPLYIHLWWATWIVGRIASSYTLRRGADDYDDYAWRSLLGEVTNAVELIGACLAAWMIMRLTARQRERAAGLGWVEPPRSRPRLRLAVAAAMPLAAAAAIVGGTLAWNESAVAHTITGETSGSSIIYDSFGVRFNYPERFLAAESDGYGGAATEGTGMVSLFDESNRHTGHVIAVEWMPAWYYLSDDLDYLTGLMVDVFAEALEIPLIRSGTPFEINSLGDLYRARTFTIESETANISGAVAAGVCPGSDRTIVVRSAYDRLGYEDNARQSLEDLLYTLDC